ncbi:hypothetical protein N7540_005507 [Penicillium herquei]|nr:hypothetical protein N7540_005507 [Penicillium herquei]
MGSTIDYANIQGDIWPGLTKRYQEFYFFEIKNADEFKPHLSRLADVITSAEGALKNRDAIRIAKESKTKEEIPLAAVNIAFTCKGMGKLGQTGFKDDPFIKGMNHDMNAEGRDLPEDWIHEFKEQKIDGVLLVCGTDGAVQIKRQEVVNNFLNTAHGVEHVLTLDGRERPGDQKGHEHFGFLDAISQPLLKGFDEETQKKKGSRKWFTRPGVILFGHEGEMNDEPRLMHPPWAKDGSLLVIRKIKQFVPEFNGYLDREAPKLGFDAGQLGARLVGRWKSGAPVEVFPDEDNKDKARWNDFDYPTDSQVNCPFASHMRKTKPRSGVNNGDKFDIMRRGIPYGPEVGPEESSLTLQDRGLIFTCYQTSLSNGFQFIKNRWVNPDTFPPNVTQFTGGKNPGQDPMIGQSVKGAIEDDDKILTMSLVDGHKKNAQITFDPFIQSNGGDYFFTPSVKFLREITLPRE